MYVCILHLLRTNMSRKWVGKSFICANRKCGTFFRMLFKTTYFGSTAYCWHHDYHPRSFKKNHHNLSTYLITMRKHKAWQNPIAYSAFAGKPKPPNCISSSHTKSIINDRCFNTEPDLMRSVDTNPNETRTTSRSISNNQTPCRTFLHTPHQLARIKILI